MKPHPRLFISPAELKRLKTQIRTGPGRKIADALRHKVDVLSKEVTPALDDTILNYDRGNRYVWALPDFAFIARLDDNTDALTAATRVLQAMARNDRSGKAKGRMQFGYSGKQYLWGGYDLICELLDPADRQDLNAWLLQHSIRIPFDNLHATFLRCAGQNIPMNGVLTALLGVLALEGDPGIPDLTRERAELVRMFEGSLYSALGPNGYPNEDIGYGTMMVGVQAFVAEALQRAGLFDAYRQCPRFAKFGRAMLHFVQPWGEHLSNTGDHGDDFGVRQFILGRLGRRDPSLLWLLRTLSYPTQLPAKQHMWPEVTLAKGEQVPCSAFSLLILDALNKKSALPKGTTQFVDRARDIVSFRSGWDKDATFVVFDGSLRPTAAQGHAHDSCGHFSLSALGEYFAIDTGRYNIEQDQHNVVLVDGKSGQSTDGNWRMSWYHGRLTDYRADKFCDTAAVDSSHMSNCYWAYRTLGLVKGTHPYVWTVEDINFANDYREFWWQLHTSPGNTIEIADNHATIHGRRHGNLLDVHFALPSPVGYPKPHTLLLTQHIQRSGSFRYVSDEEVKQRREQFGECAYEMVHGPVFERPRLVAKVAGYNGKFMSLMLPRRKGAKPAVVKQLPTLENSLAVSITFGDVEDTLIFAYEHNLLEANGVSARGQWTVVRRSLKSRKLIASALGQ